MGARGDLRHHPAKGDMFLGLRMHDIGQNPAAAIAAALDHGGGGLVAGGFDAQHQHRPVIIQI